MNIPFKALTWAGVLAFTLSTILFATVNGQTPRVANKPQAKPPATRPFGAEAFLPTETTTIRWLGNAGFLINSRGNTLMVDPLLKGFDMPLLFEMPIAPKDVPHLDAVLVTHRDNDHYSIPTCRELVTVCKAYHSTHLVSSLMKNEKLPATGHEIGEVFSVGPIRVKLTPAEHNYRPGSKKEDDCGFWIQTPDGTIWAPGDTRLMPEHLQLTPPDAIFFDFSDNDWHIGLSNAIKLANTYPDTQLLLSHWGTVDAPNFTPFNADPKSLEGAVVNPKRIRTLAPGEPFTLRRLAAVTTNAPSQSDHSTAFTGAWKLNLAKSKFSPGPPFVSFMLTFTSDGVRHLDLVGAGGTPFKASLPWSDGKEVTPIGGGTETIRVVSKIHGRKVTDTWRRGGVIIEVVHGRVSADGKTLTMDVRGPIPEGGKFHNRVVFDRQ